MKNGLSGVRAFCWLMYEIVWSREVGHQVIAGIRRRLDEAHAVDESRRPLVGLATDEPVELLEAAEGRPVIERTRRARLPHRDLVALAELRGVVPGLSQDLRQRNTRIRARRPIAGRRRGGLGDLPHTHLVMVAAAEHGRTRRRADRRGVEPAVAQPTACQALSRRHRHGTAERTGGTETDVIQQDEQGRSVPSSAAASSRSEEASPPSSSHPSPSARCTPGRESEGHCREGRRSRRDLLSGRGTEQWLTADSTDRATSSPAT